MHDDIKSVIERASKLFALAENNTNPNEAANAFAQAQKLLERHKLTRAAIEAAANETNDEPIQRGQPLEEVVNVTRWKEIIAAELCDINDCRSLWLRSSSGTRTHNIVGRASDIEVVRWFYQSITSQIEAMCKSSMAMGYGSGKRWANSFKRGATTTVVKRLIDAKNEVRAEYAGTAALVLVNRREAEVELWMDTKYPKLKSRKTATVYVETNAYNYGKEVGKRVDLSRGKLNVSVKGLLK